MGNQVKQQATSNQSFAVVSGKVTSPSVVGALLGALPSCHYTIATGSEPALRRTMAWSQGMVRKWFTTTLS